MQRRAAGIDALVARWRSVQRSPYLFPRDKVVLGDRLLTISGMEAFLQSASFGDRKEKKFHVGLLPRPYTGNLRTARVFILMLNAGLHPGDYFGEEHFPEFRRAVRRNLIQELKGEQFPMFLLNPQFAWHPGFQYWSRKFHDLLEAYMHQHGKSFFEALQFLSQQICVLQLVPYHSRSFRLPTSKYLRLPSTLAIKQFVQTILSKEAHSGRVLLVVARKPREWNVREGKNVVHYRGAATRAAHLSMRSSGGKAIARYLDIRIPNRYD
jgi:hypothetical protein